MKKLFIMALVKIRWMYLSMHPDCIKFSVKENGNDTEYYFYNIKTNTIHYNYKWID